MIAAIDHIIVRVDLNQKEGIIISGNVFRTARKYNENYRERNPVIAEVVDGLGELKTGTWIVCNYNYFEDESPLLLTDNLYSIPVNEEIFAIVDEDGNLKPVQGNVIVERVTKQTPLPLPDELKKPHNNQGIVKSNSDGWYKNQYVLWLPFSDYEICYHWNGEERRAVKIHKSEIVGYLK